MTGGGGEEGGRLKGKSWQPPAWTAASTPQRRESDARGRTKRFAFSGRQKPADGVFCWASLRASKAESGRGRSPGASQGLASMGFLMASPSAGRSQMHPAACF